MQDNQSQALMVDIAFKMSTKGNCELCELCRINRAQRKDTAQGRKQNVGAPVLAGG